MTRIALSLAVLAVAGCRASPVVIPTLPPTQLVGSLNPAVTQSTIRSTVCVAGWTRTIRPPVTYTTRLERAQIRELHLPGTPADYEEDHLMPLSLGGAPRDPRNLRPIPTDRAKADDVCETRLHRQVCAGTLTLDEAQRRISRIKS